MQSSKRNTSAPQLSSSPPPSPRGLLAALGKWLSRSSTMRSVRAWSAQLSRLARRARYWHGWTPLLSRAITVLALGLLGGLCVLVVKCALFPTDNPREEWVPARWGVPWSHSSQSWSALAARRKAQLLQGSASGGQEVNITSLWAGLGSSGAPGSAGIPAGGSQSVGHERVGGGKPPRLKYPVLWAAPFFSRSGYGTEAISYVAGLLEHGLVAPEDLWITQAGDGRHPDALDGLDPAVRQLLWDQEWHNITKRLSPYDRDRPIIVVCHVFPDCWRTKADDYPYGNPVARAFMALLNEVKVRVWGFDWFKDNGCPCPNEFIKDRVVYRVGRSMFETEKLPAPLVAHADQLDELLVPSRFSVESFSSSGIPLHKLHTLPQGINTTLFDPDKYTPVDLATLKGQQVTGLSRAYNISTPIHEGIAAMQKVVAMADAAHAGRHDHTTLAEQAAAAAALVKQHLTNLEEVILEAQGQHSKSANAAGGGVGGQRQHGHQRRRPGPGGAPFRFLSVFKWETRKGWDILLRAYFDEFSPRDDNVELHVVTHAFGSEVQDFRAYMRSAIKQLLNVTQDAHLDTRLPRVYVYDKYIPDSMYPSLYQAMDALVVPTHGEGWGRPQFEAMAMGVPVISTNWSGLTAFMDEKVAYPIRVEAIVEVDDKSPDAFTWFKGQRWAQPSQSHMQQLMREVMNNRRQAWQKGQLARRRIQQEFSILAVARKTLVEIQRMEATVAGIMAGTRPFESIDGTFREFGAVAGGVAERRTLAAIAEEDKEALGSQRHRSHDLALRSARQQHQAEQQQQTEQQRPQAEQQQLQQQQRSRRQ